jgi:GST-like protein
MTRASRVPVIGLLLIGVLCPTAPVSAQQRPAIADQIAKTYGLDSFGQIDAIRYTFNVDLAALKLKLSRSWVWEPKTDQISYEGKDKAGNPLRGRCLARPRAGLLRFIRQRKGTAGCQNTPYTTYDLDYRIVPINIGKGEQFGPDFLRISPNNKIPAIVDHEPADDGPPLALFESGAILAYLGDKTGRFLPKAARARAEVLAWLFWQMGGLGPMAGQNHHFTQYAPERIPYAIDRYVKETSRLYAVLDKRLAGRDFVADEYSIADMAIYPWVVPHERQQQKLEDFPEVKRWFESIRTRPAATF